MRLTAYSVLQARASHDSAWKLSHQNGLECSVDDFCVLVGSVPALKLDVGAASQCFGAACILWCDVLWWQWRQALGACLDPLGLSGNLRHDRPGPHLRQETVLVKVFGERWKTSQLQLNGSRPEGRSVPKHTEP